MILDCFILFDLNNFDISMAFDIGCHLVIFMRIVVKAFFLIEFYFLFQSPLIKKIKKIIAFYSIVFKRNLLYHKTIFLSFCMYIITYICKDTSSGTSKWWIRKVLLLIMIFMLKLINNIVQKTYTRVNNKISLFKLNNVFLIIYLF